MSLISLDQSEYKSLDAKAYDREKRRLISGGIFIAIGGILLLLVLICIHIISYLTLNKFNNWSHESNLLLIIGVDLFLKVFVKDFGGF